jgi:hypothetical protein
VLTENWLSAYTPLGINNIVATNCSWKGAAGVMDGAKAPSHRKSKDKPPSESGAETLNFKVTTEFKKEFKGYAVSQGMTMLELLREGFDLSKRKRKQ